MLGVVAIAYGTDYREFESRHGVSSLGHCNAILCNLQALLLHVFELNKSFKK
jgi:hypothetical protein